MKELSRSVKIFSGLILLLAFLSAVSLFLPQGPALPLGPEEELPASRPVLALINGVAVLVLYGALGLLGLWLSQKLGFPDLYDPRIANRERFLLPGLVGAGLGVFFILGDLFQSRFHLLGRFPHPPFPTSIVASATAAVGEEIVFRLFFMTVIIWLLSRLIRKKQWGNRVFWAAAVLSALAFAFGHIPSVLLLLGLEGIGEIPALLMLGIIILNGTLSLFTAYYFRKAGFLAAVGIHFWTDIVWHVLWGAVST